MGCWRHVGGGHFGYTTGDLRAGAEHAVRAAEHGHAVAARLVDSVVGAGMFGDVETGERLVTGIGHARDGLVSAGRDVHVVHTSLDERARSAADQGDTLTTRTTVIARSAQSRQITDGMVG